jgi:CheY-like chemotaxis protein
MLIVDDEENIGRSLRMILEREGYSVACAAPWRSFARTPTPERADAFLFDVRLPDGSGIDLLRSVRQNGNPAPGRDDLRARHHRRRGGGHARRRLRFSGEAAQPRQACCWP